MRRQLIITAGLLLVLSGCGSSGDSMGTGGTGGVDSPSGPGPVIDNTQWRPTDKGEEFFGTAPEDATCPPPEGDCPDLEGDECVDVPPGCLVSFVAECLDQFTVLAVDTEVCDWLTLEQPLLRDVFEGDEIEIRTFHSPLNGPSGGEARISLTLGDQMIFDERVPIPADSGPINGTWIATKDFQAGTAMLYHVDNHGDNEYLLIEVNIL
ncbi:MAG: hypothetical protein O7F08_00510 [Deltaproteobacteria bacterium]|nr:hypothetical protein [Deltaproteobacteria bacterium]